MKLSIIIPVFQGENTIIPLFNKIAEELDGKFEYEVIFVSDNATDDSWNRIKYLNGKNPGKVKGFKLKYNYGQHKALLYGMRAASGDYLITMDEDMQHDPHFIPAMLSYLSDNGLDVVYGKFDKFKRNGLRKIGSGLTRKIAGLLIPDLPELYSPFRIIRSDIGGKLKNKKDVVFIDGLIGETKDKIGEYPIEHFENRRPSSYSFLKLVLLATSVILNYSLLSRAFLILVTCFLIYFSLASITDLPGKMFFLTGLPAFFILLLLSGLVLYTWIHSRIRKEIKVAEII
jgi:polyisoprenyl-phosphate glycosyltransferase